MSYKAAHLRAAASIDLDKISATPAGLGVENLRRRGIDTIKIKWQAAPTRPSLASRLKQLFGMAGKAPASYEVAFADRTIAIAGHATDGQAMNTTTIPYDQVMSVEVVAPAAAVRIMTPTGSTDIGVDLNAEALAWLRDRIILELAGLVWRPMFNVSKRSTRVTVNPDEEAYLHWNTTENRLVAAFLSQAESKHHDLVAALETGDWTAARQSTHWMKSSTAAVGAAQLSELFQRLEIDLAAGEFQRVASLRPHIESEFHKVLDVLNGATEPSIRARETSSTAELPLLGVKALVAEDSFVNQEVVRDFLDRAGCTSQIVSSGEEALECFAQSRFDVVLMDCQMIGIDGFEATRRLRQLELKSLAPRVPVIALTAHALKDDRDLCLAAGMSDYVSKPFNESELLATIQKWLPTPGDQTQQPAAQADASAA